MLWRCSHCGGNNRDIDRVCAACAEPREEFTRPTKGEAKAPKATKADYRAWPSRCEWLPSCDERPTIWPDGERAVCNRHYDLAHGVPASVAGLSRRKPTEDARPKAGLPLERMVDELLRIAQLAARNHPELWPDGVPTRETVKALVLNQATPEADRWRREYGQIA